MSRAAVVLATLAVLAACWAGKSFLAPVLLALLLSLLLSPVVGWLQRLRLPRMVASGFTVLALVAIVVGAIVMLSQPAGDWLGKAPQLVQSLAKRASVYREPVREAQKATETLAQMTQGGGEGKAPQKVVVQDRGSLLAALLSGTPRALEEIAVVVLLLFFFLSSGDNLLRRLVDAVPRRTEKRIVVRIARDIEQEMSRYLLTITLINFALGLCTALALLALGAPSAFLWGALVFVLNFAPYVGAAINLCILTLVGLSSFDDITHALLLPGVFLALAFTEGQLVTPTILGRRLAVNPAIVFVWLMLWGWLWGVVGVLLAGPLLACFRIICQHTQALRPIYILIGETRPEEDDDDKAAGTEKR